jgi:hypothetical protein
MANTQPKTFELVYSRQSTGFLPGVAYSNPRFFTSPREGVTKVYLVGDWPNIRAAYEARGVPVEQAEPGTKIGDAAGPKPVSAPRHLTPGVDPDTRAQTHIPDNWRELPWTGPADTLTLRQLGALVSPTPVLRKAEAVAAIEAELERRGQAEPVAPPTEVVADPFDDVEPADAQLEPDPEAE